MNRSRAASYFRHRQRAYARDVVRASSAAGVFNLMGGLRDDQKSANDDVHLALGVLSVPSFYAARTVVGTCLMLAWRARRR